MNSSNNNTSRLRNHGSIQHPYRRSILQTTKIALGGYGLFLILTISGAVYYIGSSIERINHSVIECDLLSQEIEVIDAYFIRQAKDRKNLLLRGQNSEDLDKYWGNINEMTEKINTQVNVVLENPLSKPYHSELNRFVSDYTQLMEVYQQGVNIFQETQDYRAGDQFVRGKGNDVGTEITHLLQKIQTDRQRLVLEKEQHIQQFLVISAGSLIVIIITCSGLLAAIVTNPIRRIVRFTRFLEESHPKPATDLTAERNDKPIHYHQLAVNIDQIYRPLEGDQPDEVGYMLDTYSKLSSIISAYHKQLRTRDELLNCVNAAAQCLVAYEDLTVALPTVLKILGEGTGQCRAYILQNSQDEKTGEVYFNLSLEWDAPNIPSKIEAGGRFPVPVQTFPEHLTSMLKAGHATQFLASELDGLAFREQGKALSLVGVPITVSGEWWGLLGLDDCIDERVWSEVEIAVLETAATSIGSAIERDQARKNREAAERETLMARERAARAAELELANQILSIRERWLETTAAAANELLSTVNVEASVNAALETIGENLGCDRIVVLRHVPTSENLGTMQVLYEWDAPGISSQQKHPDLNEISSDGLEHWFTQLMAGQWVGGVIDAAAEDTFSRMMKILNVQSTYAVPIFVDEEFWGLMTLDHCQEAKHLSSAEIAVFKTAATSVGSAICRDQMRSDREQVERTALLGEERNRLAREIHDILAQAFTGISLQLEAAQGVLERQPEAAQTFIQQAGMLARQGLSEARRSVRALRSHALETDSLADALQKSLSEMTQGTPLQSRFHMQGIPIPLPEDLQLNLLRIGQEAITNTLRHAHANILSLTLSFSAEQVGLYIIDDGVGFDVQSLVDIAGFGLTGIRERVAQFDGQIQLLSSPNEGTEIEVTIPLAVKV